MVTKVIKIKHDLLRNALQHPDKNFFWVFGNRRALRVHFEEMADEICMSLAELPIMISKTNSCFTMPEGGRIFLKVLHVQDDVRFVQGYEILDYALHDSFYSATQANQHFIELWLQSRKRQ